MELLEKDGAKLKLKSGAAEIFGAEIGLDQTITLVAGSKLAVFTWYGAQIEITGQVHSAYIAEDTPLRYYTNVHANLENMRQKAQTSEVDGPRTIIVGPTDSGKSSLCKLLLNYATRTGWEPVYVDLDVGQGMITVPGSIAATSIKEPIHPELGLNLNVRLCADFE